MVTGKKAYNVFGDPRTREDEGGYMMLWDVPKYIVKLIPTVPSRIYMNKQMQVPLEVGFLNLINRGHANEFKTWDGCFNIRPMRGYEKKIKKLWDEGKEGDAMRYMSLHSWGIAFDCNAAWNGLGEEPQLSDGFVDCFVDAGFDWGGRWKRADGMHFQLDYLNPM